MASSKSDSNSNSSSEEERKRKKSSKKHKHKNEKKSKKQKKHKEKKKSRRNDDSDDFINMPIALPRDTDLNEDHQFGPALPPHLQRKANDKQNQTLIGPVIPEGLKKSSKSIEEKPKDLNLSKELPSKEQNNDDLNDCFGPLPSTSQGVLSSQQIELEQRALELKIAAMEGLPLGGTSDQNIREEWMLELPEVGLKSGLAALSNMKRTFYQGKERPDFSDRSSWTKTPQSEGSKQKEKPTSLKSLTDEAMEKYEKQRDAEQESIAKKHKKKHKREESLVEMHQKKLKKKQKLKEKELKASGAKPERRPFTRDVDLKLNKIDKNQTKQIVDKAKILDSKFSSGKAKYL